MNASSQCIVVGASHAAVQLIISLRQNGWEGSITVISDEAHLPYKRPPLSKGYLANTIADEQLALRAPAAYEKLDVTFKLSTTVTAIDTDNKQVHLDSGETLNFDKLALCTGARARPLPIPGADLNAIHYLRTMDDVKGIQVSSAAAKNAVIIGGGYIGLETAASLNKLGVKVTILETESRLLKRVASPQVSAFYLRLHTEEGIDIRLNTQAAELVGEQTLNQVICADGTAIDADMAIIGIGVIANTELASDAGLTVDNGILVDELAQTSHSDIVAAGDCTNHPNPILNRNLRLESVPNATEQAKAAAASLCGIEKPYAELPWFWSDQFDVKLQIAGMNHGYTEAVVRGDIDNSRSFSVFYTANNKILAADCINRPKDFMLAKKLILQSEDCDPAALADENNELKSLLLK
ncbi:MAG: FAD-dependent oxidoreductase [Porticoccaceae bacterium]|jgi:3-phenylpropionate/trans-cinnamate dioxygenase ferredoxin reductase subunit|nr:FAD-dependent oxidoreductase [Porticoccaceae bacterium]